MTPNTLSFEREMSLAPPSGEHIVQPEAVSSPERHLATAEEVLAIVADAPGEDTVGERVAKIARAASELAKEAETPEAHDEAVVLVETGALVVLKNLQGNEVAAQTLGASPELPSVIFDLNKLDPSHAAAHEVVRRIEEAEAAVDRVDAAETRGLDAKKMSEGILTNLEVEPTEEVQRAVMDYCADHTETARIIDALLDGKAEIGEVQLASPLMREQIRGMVNAFDKDSSVGVTEKAKWLKYMAGEKLFKECAIAVTGLGEDAVTEISRVRQRVNDWLEDNQHTLASEHSSHKGFNFDYDHIVRPLDTSEQGIKNSLAYVTKKFWEDARQAGQLEYHNTPFASDIVKEGFQLRSRPNQREHNGSANTVTLNMQGHSESIHFTESLMPLDYKEVANGDSEVGKDGFGITESWSGTIAIPLGEVIKTTPFARGGEYGVVRAKNEDTIKRVTVNQGVLSSPNSGTSDEAPSAQGIDRTFYADGSDRATGENYSYPFGIDNAGYVITLKSDHLREDRTDILQHPERIKPEYRNDARLSLISSASRRDFGAGKDFARQRVIDDTGGEKALDEAVRELQESVLNDPKYTGKLVVRLRGENMLFTPEG